MERLRVIVYWLCVIAVVLFLLAIVSTSGCVPADPQPKFYSEQEKHIMFVPKGCRIGDIVAPEDGIFIGKSKIIDLRIIEVPQPEKQKKIRI